jgi:hypothetical protein
MYTYCVVRAPIGYTVNVTISLHMQEDLYTVHRLGVGEAVVVGEQVALSILIPFFCNISSRLSFTVQTLVLSYQHLLTVVLACVVVVGGRVKLPRNLSICEQ